MDKVSTESFSSKTFDSYSDENLFKLYRALKLRMSNPEYKNWKYIETLWITNKNIRKVLESRLGKNNSN